MTKARILIVEDESIVAKDLQITLESLGYSVVGIAPTGKEAIEAAEKARPDLILMDVMLKGGMDGIEAAKIISSRLSIAIIYLTAYSDDKRLQQAKATGPFGYIVKPFEENQLRITIEMALFKHQAEKSVSEQKRKYEELYHNAPDGYISLDADKKIIEVNKTFMNMGGYSRQELINKSIGFLFENGTEVSALFGKNFIRNLELGLKKKNNEILPVSINSVALFEEGRSAGSSVNLRDISEIKKLEKEKTALSKEIIKLTRKIPLTDNEKLVFYSLVKYPLLNDVELSRKLKIKRSTITAIRNKLYRENFYFTLKIPDFSMIGCELATILYAKMNPLLGEEAISFLKEADAPEQVFLDATNNELAAVYISRNFTELKRHLDSFIAKCEKENIAGNFKVTYMPFGISRIEKLFDCSFYLKKIFELDMSEIALDARSSASAHSKDEQFLSMLKNSATRSALQCGVFDIKEEKEKQAVQQIRNMTPNEKIILYALVKFPSYNDSEISEIAKIPRPSISQTRAKLLSDGFLNVLNIPNFIKIGCELMVLEHIKLDYEAAPDMMADVLNHLKESIHCCSIIAGGNEIFALNVYDDYTEYEAIKNSNARFYDEHKLEMQAVSIHPILGVKFFKMQPALLISKILGLKVNF